MNYPFNLAFCVIFAENYIFTKLNLKRRLKMNKLGITIILFIMIPDPVTLERRNILFQLAGILTDGIDVKILPAHSEIEKNRLCLRLK